jgi:L-ascorbate metabolism protein UlaG (beta-lactamase superfamily)
VTLFSIEAIFGAPKYHGPKTDHFNGRRFVNVPGTERSFLSLLRWLTRRSHGHWPKYHEQAYGAKPPDRAQDLRITFINHATLLIQMNGLNILTDPIYSHRASPVSWTGPKRCRNPGIAMHDLPALDIVLISHNHYDHLDLPTLLELRINHDFAIYTSLGNKAILEKNGFSRVTEMDWWQESSISQELSLLATPSQHFSGRSLVDQNKTLWLGFVLKSKNGSVYFAGDTGYGPHFKAIGKLCPNIRLALIPIGGYLPPSFMKPVHISPEEAVKAHHDLGARHSVAMHFGTFPLSDEGEREAVADLQKALDQESQKPDFWLLDFGEGRDVPILKDLH